MWGFNQFTYLNLVNRDCNYLTLPQPTAIEPSSFSYSNINSTTVNITGIFFPLDDSVGECYWYFSPNLYHITPIEEIHSTWITCSTPVLGSDSTDIPRISTRVGVRLWSNSASDPISPDCYSWFKYEWYVWAPTWYVSVNFTNGDDPGKYNYYIPFFPSLCRSNLTYFSSLVLSSSFVLTIHCRMF